METCHLEMDLTTAQWSIVASALAPINARKQRGRPLQDTQAVLNGVFWVLRTGARWADLPERYPPYQTCHRRFREWLMNGTLFTCFRLLADDLQRRADDDGPPPDDEPADVGRVHGRSAAHPDQKATPVPVGTRSWKWHTALLLQCPLARQALQSAGKEQSPGSASENGVAKAY